MNLFKNAKVIITIPEVFAELRDSKARDLLATLPFAIEERIPSAESIKAVSDFAKKTGDFAALSKTDLRLIALTHMLELEVYGSIAENNYKSLKSNLNLRTPSTKPAAAAAPAPSVVSNKGPEVAVTSPSAAINESPNAVETEVVVASDSESEDEESDDGENEDEPTNDSTEGPVDSVAQKVDQLTVTNETDAVTPTEGATEETPAVAAAAPKPSVFSWASIASKAPTAAPKPVAKPTTVVHSAATPSSTAAAAAATLSRPPLGQEDDGFTAVSSSHNHRTTSNIVSRQSGLGSSSAESSRMAGEDDGLGWINSSNLGVHLASGGGQFGMLSTEAAAAAPAAGGESKKSKKKKNKRRVVKVACVTTDFSM